MSHHPRAEHTRPPPVAATGAWSILAPMHVLDPLSQRIVGALQVDGRASWRRIAGVLDEPVRTVARRGAALLEDRTVQVAGLSNLVPTHLLRLRCSPGRVRDVARELATRPESVFVYTLSGSAEVLAELMVPYDRLSELLLDELPRMDGVRSQHLAPVLRYFRTVAEWRPGLLTADEIAALSLPGTPADQLAPEATPDDVDLTILRTLGHNGRAPLENVAATAGISQPTARRRIDQLTRAGLLRIRAVVEPGYLGRPVEALLWIRCPPDQVDTIGTVLVESSQVRYAAHVMGDHPLIADITTADMPALQRLITTGIAGAESVESALLIKAFKRGGVVTDC